MGLASLMMMESVGKRSEKESNELMEKEQVWGGVEKKMSFSFNT